MGTMTTQSLSTPKSQWAVRLRAVIVGVVLCNVALLFLCAAVYIQSSHSHSGILSCPEATAPPLAVFHDVAGTVHLDNSDLKFGLCTLIEVSAEFATNSSLVDAQIKPIARRYHTSDWGAYAGDYSHLTFTCTDATCEVELPAAPVGRMYLLKSYYYKPKYSSRLASFLDKTTFGVTREELDNMDGSMRDWVLTQMHDIPMSSHRQFFREWSNEWAYTTTGVGLVQVDDACAIGARYRNFALIPQDRNRTLTITSNARDNTTKLFKVDGELRTVVEGPIEYGRICSRYSPVGPVSDGSYTIDHSRSPVGGYFKMYVNGVSRCIYINGVPGNPGVFFDEDNQPDDSVLGHPSNSSKVILQNRFDGTVSIRELTRPLSGSHCPTASLANRPRTTVAKLEGTNEYWIHSSSLVLANNTLESPLADGGKSAVDATANRDEDFQVLCSNVPRTFLNEDSCVLAPIGCEVDSDTNSSGPAMVCGSPFEVANVYASDRGPMGHGGFEFRNLLQSGRGQDVMDDQKESVWLNIALKGKDQLRQRVAWALYQILVVAVSEISVGSFQTEAFMTYYDIFVRHAFGNYFDILKEVTYSPLMGEMLTYIGGHSTAYSYTKLDKLEAADENYAREVMQLFSIGLYHLNQDGTLVLDNSGNTVETYTNDQIAEYAKVYTGFVRQRDRGNIERARNLVDPMDFRENVKDFFPKLGINNQYVGDGYPLCSDIPHQHFLTVGATFHLLGSSSEPRLRSKVYTWKYADPKRISLEATSELAKALCGGSTTSCNPAATTTLNAEVKCVGIECLIDEPQTFEAAPGVWFEYIRPPCVNQAFFDNAKTTRNVYQLYGLCSNPLNRDHSALCCLASDLDNPNPVVNPNLGRNILFSSERVTYEEAERRCNAIGGAAVCDTDAFVRMEADCGNETRGGCDATKDTFWSAAGCLMYVKINRAGGVAIVHEPQDLDQENDPFDMKRRHNYVSNNTKMFFRVDWLNSEGSSDSSFIDDFLRDYDDNCESLPGCIIDTFDGLCMCITVVSNEPMFTSKAELAAADVSSILASATVAPFTPPSSGWKYANSDLKYTLNGGTVDDGSFLRIRDHNGYYQYRKNVLSRVLVGGSSSIQFRNPVSFFSLAFPTVRDARYEVDATLEHYFYHQNMPPFLAVRLAQRFGVSNPSPQYVSAVSKAFRTGKYTSYFGSGDYGCMEATIAALVLEKEFRFVDADPMSGSVIEPFLKVVKVMRSLVFQSQEFVPRFKADLFQLIGEETHKLPHVFSFFKPEYQPRGRISSANLVAPEAQVLNGPTSINLVNILGSYLKYGLNTCYNGVGYEYVAPSNCVIGSAPNFGNSTYIPAGFESNCGTMVDDLADLLTGGRLTSSNHDVIVEACETSRSAGDSDEVVMANTAHLLVMTPEFHTGGIVEKTGMERGAKEVPKRTEEDYKAVIFVMLNGGMDSYNVLVPPPVCGELNEQYVEARGVLAYDDDEYDLTIETSNQGQPCDTFAVHESLPIAAEMYNDGDLIFLANTGNVDQNGMTRFNYRSMTTSTLFAHNHMQEEAQRVDPHDMYPGTGALGRAKDILGANGHVVNSIAIDSAAVVLDGQSPTERAAFTVQRTGAPLFAERPESEQSFDVEAYTRRLNAEGGMFTNIFGELWSSQLVGAMDQFSLIGDDLARAESVVDDDIWGGEAEAWEAIYKLIATHEGNRNTDRDFFYTEFGGWDHHFEMKENLKGKLNSLNGFLSKMRAQLKAGGFWDKVTIVVTSDFARTLTPNGGKGSDHAWAGNYFMMGGSIKGGRIVGKYPSDLSETSPLRLEEDISRGRMIPTTSWDAVWNGVLQWVGVTSDEDLDYCLPNRHNTVNPVEGLPDSFPLYNEGDLFKATALALDA
eukprot:Nitzschia sp. Nitz4//scaffold316_size20630//7257//13186//NITZ4_008656-RA/size20630-snap-gene-0.2-mRNA-1//1//CDS//3329547514//9254//frame0